MRNLVQAGLCAALTLAAAGPVAAQALTFTPYHANGIYAVGETVGWTLHAPAGAPTRYTYVVRENELAQLQTGVIDLTSGTATLETRLNEPGMVYVRLTSVPPPTVVGSPGELDKLTMGAAVAPLALKLSAPRPADFDAFWAAKLAQLKTVPINPVLTPTPTTQAGVTLSTVTLDSLGSHVHGYLATPATPGKHPALVILQYAGVYALQPRTVTSRAAQGWLAFDVDAHDMAPDQATAPKDYAQIGDADRETSYFLNMYLRDTRALDYIQSRPDWDGKTIVLTGGSMGGQQSLVTAGLNPDRVTAVIVNEPAGDDFDAALHGRKGGYPNWPSTDAAVMRTGLYFDTVNFASLIRAPALVSMGFIDTIATPAGIWTAFNQIPGPKEAAPALNSDHNNTTPAELFRYNQRSEAALDSLLKTGAFTPDADWASKP